MTNFHAYQTIVKKKNIAFILYTLYNTDIGMSKLQYLFDNVSICWAMAHLKMSSRWSLWWSSAALLGVKEGPIITYGVENISQSICRNVLGTFSEMVKFCLFEEEHVHLSFVDEYKWKVKLQTVIDGTF